jgi:hypothetical protein
MTEGVLQGFPKSLSKPLSNRHLSFDKFNPNGFVVASCSGGQKWYALRVVHSVGLVADFAKRPDNMLNLARWTAQGYALTCRLASTLGNWRTY